MRRALLLCGVISPLLYAVADTLAGVLSEGYSFRDQTISELGAVSYQLWYIVLALRLLREPTDTRATP